MRSMFSSMVCFCQVFAVHGALTLADDAPVDWVRWALKGYKGFLLTVDDIRMESQLNSSPRASKKSTGVRVGVTKSGSRRGSYFLLAGKHAYKTCLLNASNEADTHPERRYISI